MTPALPGEPSDSNSLTDDERRELLSSRFRRYTLYSLWLFTTPLSLARVADYVTMWEFGVSADELPQERLEIYMALYYEHVPPLAEAGVVVYDQADDTLDLGRNGPQLLSILERTITRELTERHRAVFTDRSDSVRN